MANVEGLTIFTEEEFDTIFNEVLDNTPAVFTTLLMVLDRAFSKSVRSWCNGIDLLKGGLHEEDIMQEIKFKVTNKVITHFFKRDDLGGKTNYDPLGFQKWLFTLVGNAKKSYFNMMLRRKHSSWDDENVQRAVDSLMSHSGDYYTDLRTKEVLEESFKIVIESEARPYTVLTWIAQCLFFIKVTEKGGEINEGIDALFGEKTLYEMRDILFKATSTIEWMKLTEKGKEKINKALDAPFDQTHSYGEMRYLDFYMKKGPKSTISDWINKMNNIIKKQVAAK